MASSAGSGRRVRRGWGERIGVTVDRVRAHVGRRQAPEPGVLVRREHAERPAGLREHLVALEDHLVLRGPERDAASGERLRDRGVAVAGRGLVVAVRVDGARPERGGELGNRVPGERVPDDQSAAARAERGVELAHAVPDELHAPVVRRRQRVEDLAIEDEGAEDRARFPQRVEQRRVIEIAQVAAEPDQRAVLRALGHGRGPGAREAQVVRAHLVAPQQRTRAVVALEDNRRSSPGPVTRISPNWRLATCVPGTTSGLSRSASSSRADGRDVSGLDVNSCSG